MILCSVVTQHQLMYEWHYNCQQIADHNINTIYTVKTEVSTGQQNVPIMTPLVIMVSALGHFGVRRTLLFLHCILLTLV